MRLSPNEQEKLLLDVAGIAARDRLGRGVKLNHPEAVALFSAMTVAERRYLDELYASERVSTRAGVFAS